MHPPFLFVVCLCWALRFIFVHGQEEIDPTLTCVNRCDDRYIPDLPCYCNDACGQYENCCFDYYQLCQPNLTWSKEWQEYNNHTYKFFYSSVTGNLASEACREHGAMLVSINSGEEQIFIEQNVLKQRTLSGFIGATDVVTEDVWKWFDGELVPRSNDDGYANWYEGQPDDAGGAEDCGIMTKYTFWETVKVTLSSYYWMDHSCSVNAQDIQGYICERTLACEPNPCQNNGTCMYVGGDLEMDCVCQEGFVGDRCQIELIEGAVWEECGETLLTGSTGEITSPLYPTNYPPLVNCRWKIEVEPNKTVSILVTYLDLEDGKNCVFDSLRIYDGDADSPLLIGPVCGTLSSNSASIHSNLRSAANVVVVEFLTDASAHQLGFRLEYTADDCGTGTGESGCNTGRLFQSSCGQIDTSSRPEADSACEWLISVQEGHIVNISFAIFNIEDTGLDCERGGLTLYDGADDDADVIETYCGQRFSWFVLSSGSDIYLRLEGLLTWDADIHEISLSYETLESSEWQTLNHTEVVTGNTGYVNANSAIPTARLGDTCIYRWLLQAPIGELLEVTWEFSSSFQDASLRIYDGYSELSRLLVEAVSDPVSGINASSTVQAASFQVLVEVKRPILDQGVSSCSFRSIAWGGSSSGCYMPSYMSRPESLGSENNLVRPLEPVVAMVSEHSYDLINPGYDAGMYCRFLVESANGLPINLAFLEVAVYPKTRGCHYDGFVIYDGSSTQDPMNGTFCGDSEEVNNMTITSSSDKLLVVFYSDTRGNRRKEGILRALVQQTDDDACPIHHMADIQTKLIEWPESGEGCGVVLSPNFPGTVPPNHWLWRIEGSLDTFFIVNVYYVRGPGIEADCVEFFKVLEITRDAQDLRQYEGTLLKACGETELFAPDTVLKLPPSQKIGIELNTLENTAQRQWQFKLSYESAVQDVPEDLESETEMCPGNYTYFRGSCYRYYYWVHRHYHQEQYAFQETWEKALAQCEAEGGTLVSIQDEQEAEFLKYSMSITWFWDPAGTFQNNHRLIYIGLHNKEENYSWTDGTALAYSDWYIPPQEWEQSLLYDDSVATDLIDVTRQQPSADEGSLCTALVAVSPFKSLNWAKIPCDYPMFRAGVMCEQPATRADNTVSYSHLEINSSLLLLQNYNSSGEGKSDTFDNLWKHGGNDTNNLVTSRLTSYAIFYCPDEWYMISSRCLRLQTHYTPVMSASVYGDGHYGGYNLSEAEMTCDNISGRIAIVDDILFANIRALLEIWRHSPEIGHIWVAADIDTGICKAIKAYKNHRQDAETQYELISEECSVLNGWPMYNVLCQTDKIAFNEECSPSEYTCNNGMCTSPDNVCDGSNDCRDGSDEENCDASGTEFICNNGKHIPISLFCNFYDNCGDNWDERSCVTEVCGDGQYRCESGQCIDAALKCDFRYDCADKSDEGDICDGECSGFLCYSGRCLDDSLKRDAISDCPGLAQEDESNDIIELNTIFDKYFADTSSENETFINWCVQGPDYVQCRHGESRCYHRGETCRYDNVLMDEHLKYSVTKTCRTGDHLRMDCDLFECPRMFHCPGSFWMPYDKVCDGVRHCPGGEDESLCEVYICPGLFQCKGESFCLPRDKVCDGVVDCLTFREDEKYCHSSDLWCDSPCECCGYSLTCENYNLTTLRVPNATSTRQLRSITLSNNHLVLTADHFAGLHWLARLDLSHNGLTTLSPDLFIELRNLQELDLSNNLLTEIPPVTFHGLTSLRKLDLGSNMLYTLRREVLAELTSLEHLILTNNQLGDVKQEVFEDLSELRILNTDEYSFCCIAGQVDTCTPEPDEFSSCEDLMANSALQISIWVLGLSAFFGNLFVVIWHMSSDRQRPSSFFIFNLGMSDFLMGVYMLIIASVDVYHRGVYILVAHEWRSSWLCQTAGILAMVSSEVSVFMVTAITAERMLAILFPMKIGHFRIKHARYVALGGWITCLFLSILPATSIPYFGDSFFGRTGVCLPFHLSNDQRPGWEYSVFIFLVVNLFSFIFIFFGYLAIFLRVKSSLKEMGEQSTSNTNEYDLAKKLAIIVITDFFCWVPIILIGFVALGGVPIPPEVAAWIAVFVLPLNSSVNPILYTISAIDCNGAAAKRRRTQSYPSPYGTSRRTVTSTVIGRAPGVAYKSQQDPTPMVDIGKT